VLLSGTYKYFFRMEITEQPVGFQVFGLKEYAQYLIAHKLHDAALKSIHLLKEYNLSVPDLPPGYTEEELLAICRQLIEDFLNHLHAGTALEASREMIDNWKESTLKFLPEEAIKADDFTITFNIRRQVLVELLLHYTTDPILFAAINGQIEKLFNEIQKYLVQAHIEVNQENLYVKNEFLSSLISHSAVGISVYDKTLRILEWNTVLERESKFKRADVLGKRLHDLIPGHSNSLESGAIRKAFEGEIVFLRDSQYKTSGNWYDGYVIPLYNIARDEVTAVLCIGHDVTERRKHEQTLISQQQKLEETNAALTAKIREMKLVKQALRNNEVRLKEAQVVAKLGHWEVNYVTPSASLFSDGLNIIFGLDPDQDISIGKASELIYAEDLELISQTIAKAVKTGLPYTIIYRITTPKGESKTLLDKGIPVRNKAGKTIAIKGITQDISDRIKIEKEIISANQKLTEANKALTLKEQLLTQINNELEERVQQRTAELVEKNNQLQRINTELDTFVYTASHDLKSPITNMEGLMMAIDRRIRPMLSEQENALLDMMDTSVKRLRRTIHDLTEVINVQRDMAQAQPELIQLPDLIEEIQSDLEGLISTTKAQITTALFVENLVFSRKDIRSILLNLITNAIKYHVPGTVPEVHIEVRQQAESLELMVSDNGLGIPASQQDKIFSLFKRVNTQVEGSGIGLYLVKKIVEDNGGTVSVISEQGQGSTFKVVLLMRGQTYL
jgi:PAS domain S-box-containing protein